MKETKLVSMYSEALQESLLSVVEGGLLTIEKIGDEQSKEIARKSLNVLGCLMDPVSMAKAPTKAKAKGKAKKSRPFISKPKRPNAVKKSITIIAPDVDEAGLNGDCSSRMRAFRKKESLSQKNAAIKAEVSISSWQAWENGKWTPSEDNMRVLERIGV